MAKRPTKKGPDASGPVLTRMAQFYGPSERLKAIAEAVQAGAPLPEWAREWLAAGLQASAEGARDPWGLNAKVGRPKLAIDTWEVWSAWFAAFCDPEFNALPKTAV